MAGFQEDCVFCRIVRGDFGTGFVAENKDAVAFSDLHPQAPTHILVASRMHFENIVEFVEAEPTAAGSLVSLAVQVARDEGIVGTGFRLLTNTGADAGQSVQHLHFHVLGGKHLREGLA
jgi:histidine triad (HIT) family protein